jgi:hypothetical protein
VILKFEASRTPHGHLYITAAPLRFADLVAPHEDVPKQGMAVCISSCRATNLINGIVQQAFGFTLDAMDCCPAEQKLLAAFAAAALAHLEAVHSLRHLVEAHSKHEFEGATLRAEQTASKCKAAHLALEKHRLEHIACLGGAAIPPIPNPLSS